MSDEAPGDAAGHFTLQSRVRDASLEIVAAGELDMTAAFSFESTVEAHLAAGGLQAILLDLGQIAVVDSAGLGALLSVRDQAGQRGIALHLTRVSDPVRKVLDLTGLGDIAGD